MGHFTTTVRGRGKNRSEAQSRAVDNFFHEHGHRHNLRDVTAARFLGKVPPMGVVTRKGRDEIWDYTKPNTAAPPEEWLEEWEFDLHTHA
jgi:hypothetical protein